MQLPESYTYPIYTAIIALALVLLVPRNEIRRLFIYGIIFGALGDFVTVLLLMLFNIGGHMNYGPFGFLGIAFFPIMAWTLWFIMFFYYMPKQPIFLYIYVFAAAVYSAFFSNVLVNLNVFVWNAGRVIVPFLIYFGWFSLATWGYHRIGKYG